MKSLSILLLSAATFFTYEINASGGASAATATATAPQQQHPTPQARVDIPWNIINAAWNDDSKTIIEWINKAPENKNADDNGTPLFYFIIGMDSDDVFKTLLEQEANTLGEFNERENVLDSLLTNSTRPEKILKRAIPLVELMIKQGADLDELLQKIAEREELFRANRRFSWHKKVHAIDEKIKKIINDEKAYRAGKKEAQEAQRVTAQDQTILKEIMGKNFKELFDKPQGDQIIVHKIKKAIRLDNTADLKKLVGKQNQYIELKDENGYTPLLQAVYTNKPAAVEFLLKQGANPEAAIIAADGKPLDALGLARLLGYEKVIKLLLDAPKSAAHKK